MRCLVHRLFYHPKWMYMHKTIAKKQHKIANYGIGYVYIYKIITSATAHGRY
jgi:hypothetical protein